jgi:hypothetical protein
MPYEIALKCRHVYMYLLRPTTFEHFMSIDFHESIAQDIHYKSDSNVSNSKVIEFEISNYGDSNCTTWHFLYFLYLQTPHAKFMNIL